MDQRIPATNVAGLVSDPSILPLPDLQILPGIYKSQSDAFQQAAKGLVRFTNQRVFFVTSHGYIGMASQETTKVGDNVAVIRGVTLPVILHPKESHYKVVDEESYGTYQSSRRKHIVTMLTPSQCMASWMERSWSR